MYKSRGGGLADWPDNCGSRSSVSGPKEAESHTQLLEPALVDADPPADDTAKIPTADEPAADSTAKYPAETKLTSCPRK